MLALLSVFLRVCSTYHACVVSDVYVGAFSLVRVSCLGTAVCLGEPVFAASAEESFFSIDCVSGIRYIYCGAVPAWTRTLCNQFRLRIWVPRSSNLQERWE